MRKVMKKISAVVLSLSLALCAIVNVKAYDANLNISTEKIRMDQNTNDEVIIYGDLKNDAAKVSQQYVEIDEATFNKINSKMKEVQEAYNEVDKRLNEQNAKVSALEVELEELKRVSETEGATAEDKRNTELKEKEVELAKEEVKKIEAQKRNVDNSASELREMIKSFDDSKWELLSNTKDQGEGRVYAYKPFTLSNYAISWVKVELNGQATYNYELYCYKIGTATVTKPSNPKTGIENYYAYAVAVLAIAICGYVTVRSRKRLSR